MTLEAFLIDSSNLIQVQLNTDGTRNAHTKRKRLTTVITQPLRPITQNAN